MMKYTMPGDRYIQVSENTIFSEMSFADGNVTLGISPMSMLSSRTSLPLSAIDYPVPFSIDRVVENQVLKCPEKYWRDMYSKSHADTRAIRNYMDQDAFINFSALYVPVAKYKYLGGKNMENKKANIKDWVDKTNGTISGIPLIDSAIQYNLKKVKVLVKNHFGIERDIVISDYPEDTRCKLYAWMSRYCPRIRTQLRRMRKIVETTPILLNSSFFMAFDKFTFADVKIGSAYRETITDSRSRRFCDNEYIPDDAIHIYIFGRNAYQYFAEMHKILSNRIANILFLYNVSGLSKEDKDDLAFKSTRKELERRDLSTIFMEPGVVEEVTHHIDRYLNNQGIYSDRGIIYKTGILLYGNAGTGKTSLIKAIASKYDRDLIVIDMPTFDRVDTAMLSQVLNSDKRRYIVALEDIDCMIADRENKDIDKDDKKIVNKLLQFLDSNSSPNNVIFIATTNHVELIDEALLREGRFDLKREINGIYKSRAIDMCRSFELTDKQIDTVLDRVLAAGIDLQSEPVTQSKLQKMILDCVDMNIRGDDDED